MKLRIFMQPSEHSAPRAGLTGLRAQHGRDVALLLEHLGGQKHRSHLARCVVRLRRNQFVLRGDVRVFEHLVQGLERFHLGSLVLALDFEHRVAFG